MEQTEKEQILGGLDYVVERSALLAAKQQEAAQLVLCLKKRCRLDVTIDPFGLITELRQMYDEVFGDERLKSELAQFTFVLMSLTASPRFCELAEWRVRARAELGHIADFWQFPDKVIEAASTLASIDSNFTEAETLSILFPRHGETAIC